MELALSPVKESASRLRIPVVQPEKIKNNEGFSAQLEQIKPDAIIVVGYGRIIPQWMRDLPRWGNINLHASLLPKYRGAAPIQWAIANGESVTGNTTMRINAGLDTGDILMQQRMSILPNDTALTLAPRLAASGAELMRKTLQGLENGTVHPIRQDESQASLAPILTKEDGRIDFSRTAKIIADRLCGFQPWPGAFTTFRGGMLKLTAAHPHRESSRLKMGELRWDGAELLAGCGDGTTLAITELQLEGKKKMPAASFVQGHQPRSGERLGE
jgi:methionyl-tRNA formyltransferase